MPDKDLLTVQEVAGFLRTTPNTVYRWLRSGKISGIKIGKEWRINKDALEMSLLTGDRESGRTGAAGERGNGDLWDLLRSRNDHVLVVTSNSRELYDLEARFFRMGMDLGYRLFKGCWWQHPDDARKELARRDVPVQALEGRDALVIVDLQKQYWEHGLNGPVRSWTEEAAKTSALGYDIMWGSGSPSPLSCDGDFSRLVDFERVLHQELKGRPVVGICPYVLEHYEFGLLEPFIELARHHSGIALYEDGKSVYLRTPVF